ncbi:sulfurtransferase TusA family protein [Acinetobacter rudis]|uniref:Sulfurtransferase TusA family protein n=1 Tax=Acinetobacter rudis TaxID=632955 RepID=A0AAW8J5B6_9GAMM|nr:sulfurtransferase TusA family protein [Acinetobacter rudis]MDQ8934376.1 sulfurtransferase TusA family protein [Acinetobacter rudis]MDQ9016724.1 sulfurtransferase TusA family protein [Acinetobacter rudis]
MNSIVEIDARGKPCPMPLLMLKRAIKQAGQSHCFHLLSSDPHSEIDIVRYCQLNGISCRAEKISATEYHYFIEY